MRRLRILLALGLGLAIGGLGAALGLTPGWSLFEEGIGQSWLFRLRGPLPPPDDVAVVTLDLESAERLGLPEKLREWPRDVHARLVERLAAAGASAIALDLSFERPRADPAEDAALGRAVAAARCVVLLELIRKHDRSLDDAGGVGGMLTTRRIVRPLPELAGGALAIAPLPLPKQPMRLNHFWTFVPDPKLRPTMPVAVLRHHLRRDDRVWRALLEEVGVLGAEAAADLPLGAEMAAVRTRLLERPLLALSLREGLERAGGTPEERHAAARLIDLYSGPNARWIDFYGPPGQITTWPVHAVLDDGAFETFRDQVEGRAIFIGLSELHSDHEDDFRTVYSEGGVDLAGVEIAATIFANFLEGRLLEPLSGWRLAVLLMVFGFVIAAVASALRAPFAVPAGLALALAYGWLAVLAFEHAWWLPVAIPLLVQLPLGLFGGLFLQYRAARRAERNLTSGMTFYVPDAVASALAEEPAAASRTELVDGVCFVSDIADFTRVAERLPPGEVSRLLNRYFEVAFAAIRTAGGTVTDIVGDGITAFWRGTDPATRQAACRAALEVERAVMRLEVDGGGGLPTRIGLNMGRVVLGGVGGSGRFAYSVIGDAVNTASRIEKLNKHLGTRVIASAGVVCGLQGLVLRPLGDFVLYGKGEPEALVEIVDQAGGDRAWAGAFAAACEVFRAGLIAYAARGFERVLAARADGPSRFYLRLCRSDPTLPARREADGVVRLLEK